ncbi:MAG: hypothetical protein KIT62_03825 [Cyclobacteriaceae bacterium]|nr:hypothetical protein [Cyclobacteriaceae bacterium]
MAETALPVSNIISRPSFSCCALTGKQREINPAGKTHKMSLVLHKSEYITMFFYKVKGQINTGWAFDYVK